MSRHPEVKWAQRIDKVYITVQLPDAKDVKASKINTGVRSIFCVLEKAEKGWWKKLLRGDQKTPHYIKVDWDKWVDEDDDGGDVDLGGMDFSNFGGMGGDGMDDDLEDSDDEEQEVEKPSTVEKTEDEEKTVETPSDAKMETSSAST
ncbi:hypothetical protein ACMD2_13990 [Ananas comosus]|uniref:Co-chaperone protein p23 n=1 Tax=Ananas comosus TaxID=4615 RepID=A0A199V141_ANACO|nr:hypothetical protein ACMD2_13990 [Ananas comosus]